MLFQLLLGSIPVFTLTKYNSCWITNQLSSKQRRLNMLMKKDVVKREIIKWLDVGDIYPIVDNIYVCHVSLVPKKGGIIVVTYERNELVPI